MPLAEDEWRNGDASWLLWVLIGVLVGTLAFLSTTSATAAVYA